MSMELLNILNEHYPMRFDTLEQLRDGGSTSYAVFSGCDKYFLRVIKPAFFDTAIIGADVQVFLQRQNFPVPPIIFTADGLPYAKMENSLLILYEFIEGSDSDPLQDAEVIGSLIGRLHLIMKSYPGELVRRDKHFYIGRYIEILRNRQYPRLDEYIAYGEALWNQIKDLPQGYCHGDMYDGNIRKAPDGKLYIHDFDTSCLGFPMYDPTLICDMTKYFEFDERNYDRSNKILSQFLPEYRKFNPLSQAEINAFHPLIAVQHFSTQATVMECFGSDCLSDTDIDNQLDWLYRWREQCGKEADQETDEERRARIYPIILREYNPAWPDWYAEEKTNLERLLGGSIVRIQHIGSTAVPGLTAKPTVDILLEVPAGTDFDEIVAVFSPHPEYICLYPPTNPEPLCVIKGYTDTGFAEKVFHVHVREAADYDEPVFRDYLIAHPEAADEYAALKHSLLQGYEHDRDGYTNAKGEFVKNIISKAQEESKHGIS